MCKVVCGNVPRPALSSDTYSGCTFRGNVNSDPLDYGGGAIFWRAPNGRITINATDFVDNHALNTQPHGGAVSIEGNDAAATLAVNISRTLWDGNSCEGTDWLGGAWGGGAMYISQAADVRIWESKFLNNHCSFVGGAIYAAKDFTISALTIDTVLFQGNTALRSPITEQSEGGALALYSPSSTIHLLNGLTFRNNSALYGGALSFNPGGSSPFVNTSATNSFFYANSAREGAGVFLYQDPVQLDMEMITFCANANSMNIGSGSSFSTMAFQDIGGIQMQSTSRIRLVNLNLGSSFACGGISDLSLDGTPRPCEMLPDGYQLQSCSLDPWATTTAADLLVVGTAWLRAGPSPSAPTTVIAAGASLVVTSDTVIQGDLVLSPGSLVVVTPGATLVVTGIITIQGNASLNVQIASSAANGPQTITVATASAIVGSFGAITTQFDDGSSNNCRQADLLDTTYTSTSISVLVNVNSNNACSGGSLSPGAIAGIVIASVIGGALVAVLIILLLRWQRKRTTDFILQELRTTELHNARADSVIANQRASALVI